MRFTWPTTGCVPVEMAREFHPDVVLLDLALPGLTGYEVAAQLREEVGLRDVLLVAIGGYGQEEDRRGSKEAGFNAHFLKPADPNELLATPHGIRQCGEEVPPRNKNDDGRDFMP